MLQDEARKREIMIAGNGGARDHLQAIGVAIIGFKERQPSEIGSGTCVQIAGRYFIATAAHVIEPYRNDQLFLITQQERQDWTPAIIGRGVDLDLDIGWLEIPAAVAAETKRRFIGVDRMRRQTAHVANDLVLVYGYPSAKVTLHAQEQGVGVQPVCYATNTLDPEERPANAIATQDIHLAYPSDGLIDSEGKSIDGIEAYGLSGGGIWAMDITTRAVWSPDAMQLLGIERSWLDWKWVRGTQIQHWLMLLARDLPELAGAVA